MAGAIVLSLAAAAVIATAATPFAGRGGGARPDGAHLLCGVWADTFDQHSFVTAIVVTPLALLRGVFYSARTLDEPWSTLTRLDPIYYLVDATRYGFTGFHESAVAVSLGVAAFAALATFAAAAAIVAHGWRLKP